MMEEWLGQHRAFMGRKSARRPVELRRWALVAIDAGGVDGVAMVDVHRAIKSAHLPAKVVNLVVDRLVADGHVHRVRVETAGRPRIQMWSYQNAPKEVRPEMAGRGLRMDFSRSFWAGKWQEQIIQDVLRLAACEMRARDIEVAAWQIYADANQEMNNELFGGPRKSVMTYAQMRNLLGVMALKSQIRRTEKRDAFRF